MVTIYQSHINELGIDFEAQVEALRQAKLAHRFEIGSPAPIGHPLLEAAIRRVRSKLTLENPTVHEGPDDFILDYEIVNDIYVPTLGEKKQKLRSILIQDQNNRINAIIPPGKRRLYEIKAGQILSVNFFFRTSQQRKLLKEIKSKMDVINSIIRHSAIIESMIEDLTDDDIDNWTFPDWPKIGG